MQKIKVLDCTLRDGGYCNNWEFGNDNIRNIIQSIENAKVDIIECGFLKTEKTYDINRTIFTSVMQLNEVLIRSLTSNSMYVCMANYGQILVDDIDNASESFIDGIRVAFHKRDMECAIELCRQIRCKGYEVFLQPMNMIDYSKDELHKLISLSNSLDLYAFYIVDSFGNMKVDNLKKMYAIIDRRLRENITIGLHSHNNLQLSYSNAQEFLRLSEDRSVIIDCSIFGMGRGAGNLNTELFLQYLNDNYDGNYDISPILSAYDKFLYPFYANKPWGYSFPNYISASYNSHPNYATFWTEKNTLNFLC